MHKSRRLLAICIALALLIGIAGTAFLLWPPVMIDWVDPEAIAPATLKTYFRAQDAFMRKDLDGNGEHDFGASLAGLLEAGAGDVLPSPLPVEVALATGPDHGYRGYYFVLERSDTEREVRARMPWLLAVPCRYNDTGRNTYLITGDALIFCKDMPDGPPTGMPVDPTKEGWERH